MLNKKKLGGRYEFQFDISSDTIALIYFAERYRFDLITLLLLYEKFGRDVFYFFFMLAGRKIMFPKANKFLNITEFCKNVTRELLEGKPATINNKEYKAVYDSVMDKVIEDEKGVKRFSHSIRVYNNETGRFDFESLRESGCFDEELAEVGACDGCHDDDFGDEESVYVTDGEVDDVL